MNHQDKNLDEYLNRQINRYHSGDGDQGYPGLYGLFKEVFLAGAAAQKERDLASIESLSKSLTGKFYVYEYRDALYWAKKVIEQTEIEVKE